MPVSAPAVVMQERVVDELGQEIVDGVVEAGHRYTLEGLQERFGISRTVARDAMGSREALGLVQSRRRVGLQVQPRSDWAVRHPRVIGYRLGGVGRDEQFRELAELRAAVEPMAAICAAARSDAAGRLRLRELASQLAAAAESDDPEEFLRVDTEFHSVLLRSTDNAIFASMGDLVEIVLRGRIGGRLVPSSTLSAVVGLHAELAEAIASGRSGDAERHCRRLVGEVRDAGVSGMDHLSGTSERDLAARED